MHPNKNLRCIISAGLADRTKYNGGIFMDDESTGIILYALKGQNDTM
jgi:hypothetical protein